LNEFVHPSTFRENQWPMIGEDDVFVGIRRGFGEADGKQEDHSRIAPSRDVPDFVQAPTNKLHFGYIHGTVPPEINVPSIVLIAEGNAAITDTQLSQAKQAIPLARGGSLG
jgi:hypothetical protein